MLNVTAAAQDILDAYNTEADRLDREVSDKEMLSAALRAAVAVVEFPPRHDADTLWNAGFDYAQRAVLGDLLAIADELDGIKYGTYRCNLKDKP